MRLSTLKDDAGYLAWCEIFSSATKCGMKLHVTLDGIEQDGVLTADTDAGFIIKWRLTCDQGPVRDIESLLYERIEGKVEIALRGGNA